MTERETKREVLNLRLGEALASEIDRIAERRGTSASEVGRTLLEHGVRVERLLEAQELRRHYASGPYSRGEGEIEITARFRPYTRLELEQRDWDAEDWERWEEEQLQREREKGRAE
jgi:hypothetical protein